MTAPNDPNLYILPRPDGRKVYHFGSIAPAPLKDQDFTKCYHLGAYTDGAINVTAHWWGTEVTDRTNCPIVIRRSPANLVAANRMFPFGNTGVAVPPQPPRVPYTQMGASNIYIGMDGTGERPDIGLVTDNSAYYMLGKDPAPMIDWAQGAGSCPNHFRDEATGKPIDLLKYPTANAFDGAGYQGVPWLAKGPPNPQAPAYSQWGGGWTPQQAHYCEMSYVAYQATLDAGFLEDLQYSANFTVLCDAGLSKNLGKATIHGEYRGVGWAFRNLFMAHASTKDAEAAGTLPASCHPSSYWRALLDNALGFYSRSMTDPARQVFRLVADTQPNGTAAATFAPWQCDYMLTALAFGVLTGHADWMPLYLWALKNAIDRTSGQSGYPPGFGGAYYLDAQAPDWNAAWRNGVPGLGGAEPATQAEISALSPDQYHGGVPLRGRPYLMNTRAALVMAQYIHLKGLADVKSVYPMLDTCVDNVDRMLRSKLADGSTPTMNPRASVVLDASQVPASIPPLPTTQPPPTTEPPMSDNLESLKAAVETIKADVAAEIKAVHDRIVAIIAAATGTGVSVDPTELQAQVDALNSLHQTLTADTASLPTATS